jgi:hypothetical protein
MLKYLKHITQSPKLDFMFLAETPASTRQLEYKSAAMMNGDNVTTSSEVLSEMRSKL